MAQASGKKKQVDEGAYLCEHLHFSAAEAYKMLRTNLLFSLPHKEGCRVIGITSSIRGEGKSTTAVNLAYTLAETGKKVLLIDADMRLPSVAKKLDLAQTPGLSNFLAGLCEASAAVRVSRQFKNWHIMPAGNIPPNPSELLGADVMRIALERLGALYDYIVVDLPPVNVVSDALAVSQWIDGMILVVRENYTDRGALSFCMNQLQVLGPKLLGTVMTNAGGAGKAYRHYGYGKYGYGKYGYGYSSAKRKAEGQSEGQGQSETP